MNSHLLEKRRLQGRSFDVEPRIAKVQEMVSFWSELSVNEKAETLNLVRLIFGELKRNIQLTWKVDSFAEALLQYRGWESYVSETSELQQGLDSIKSDPAGIPTDYQREIDRDRKIANYLFEQITVMPGAEFSVAVSLLNISDETMEHTLKTLARYESDIHFHKDGVNIITSFVNACKASSEIGRYTRVGEIAADYFGSHFFSGAICRETALKWFNQTLMLEPSIKGLIRRTIIKRIVRSVWVFYWSTRISHKILIDDLSVVDLLVAELQ